MEIEPPLGLHDFSGTNFARRSRDHAADVGSFEIRRKIQRLREKAIAQKHAQRISPARVDGGLGAAPFGLVHNVVVDEGGDVDQLHDHRQVEMPGRNSAAGAPAEQRDQRAQPFPAGADRIGDVTFQCRIERSRLPRDPRFDFFQLRLHRCSYPGQSAIARDRGGSRIGKNFHEPTIGGAPIQRKLPA